MKYLLLVCAGLLSGCQSTDDPLSGLDPDGNQVAHQLKFAHNRLDVLSLLGAKACLPASVAETELNLGYAQASFEGNLHTDAASSLIIVNRQLNKIDSRLDYLKRNTPCAEDQKAHPQLLNSLALLLNSNNQFAFGKAKLTVSYKNNLAAAAQMLRKMPYLKLELTGHTDDVGSDNDNHSLSLSRANAVKAFLIEQQIQAKRLTVDSVGESQPLTANNDTTAQLANRRVNIALVVNQYQPNNPTLALKHWHKVLSPTTP